VSRPTQTSCTEAIVQTNEGRSTVDDAWCEDGHFASIGGLLLYLQVYSELV